MYKISLYLTNRLKLAKNLIGLKLTVIIKMLTVGLLHSTLYQVNIFNIVSHLILVI